MKLFCKCIIILLIFSKIISNNNITQENKNTTNSNNNLTNSSEVNSEDPLYKNISSLSIEKTNQTGLLSFNKSEIKLDSNNENIEMSNVNNKEDKIYENKNDLEEEKRNQLLDKIQEVRVLHNLTDTETIELLEQIKNYDNFTDYDDFDFKDIQKVLLNGKGVNEDEELTEEDIKNKKEWEEQIKEFEAAELTTFEVNEGEQEYLYDVIDTANSLIRISVFVNDEKNRMDFSIYDPQGKLIYNAQDKIHIFHNFYANVTGEYVYVINNKINDIPLKITFGINQGHSCDLKLSKEHINSTYAMIQNIKHLIKNAKFAARLLTKKYDSHYEFVQKHNRNFFFYAMIETFALILIFFFQLCYIKSLINTNSK